MHQEVRDYILLCTGNTVPPPPPTLTIICAFDAVYSDLAHVLRKKTVLYFSYYKLLFFHSLASPATYSPKRLIYVFFPIHDAIFD